MRNFKKCTCVFSLALFIVIGSMISSSYAGALADVKAKRDETNASSEKIGVPVDLKAIASPKKGVSFTGFPEGTLPGSGGPSTQNTIAPLPGKVVPSGDPLESLSTFFSVGMPLNRICTIVDHAGYRLAKKSYSASALDSPYSFVLLKGKSKIADIYMDRSLKLVSIVE